MKKTIIKKRVLEAAEFHGVEYVGDMAYKDLMQNIENEVQEVIIEEGSVEYQ